MNLKRMSIEQLLAKLREASAATGASLKQMALVWTELAGRGHDMSHYNSPLAIYFPDIAGGKLAPEMALLYGGNATIMAHVATLVPEEQAKLIANGGVVELLDSSGRTPRAAPLAGLTAAKVRQVIGEGRIRTPAEQRRHIPPPAPERRPTLREMLKKNPTMFDITDHIDMAQSHEIQDKAEKAGIEPAEWIVRQLVTRRLLRDKLAPVTRETRKKLQAALGRRSAETRA